MLLDVDRNTVQNTMRHCIWMQETHHPCVGATLTLWQDDTRPVSYTHLDVYKRQDFGRAFKVAGFSGYAFDLYWDCLLYTSRCV